MKRVMILTVGVFLLFAVVPAAADQATDEAAIRKLFDEFPAHFNEHDAQALMPFFDENVELFGSSWKSHAEAQENYEAIFERQKDMKVTMADLSIVFATPEVALAQGSGQYAGLVDADGESVAPSKAVSVAVLVKKGGKWLIRAIYERPTEE